MINQGQIYKVHTDMPAKYFKAVSGSPVGDRDVIIKAGEHIEIRFPYEWHFRTEDDVYFHSSEERIRNHCTLVGVILSPVFYNNKAKLAEIIRLELYKKV